MEPITRREKFMAAAAGEQVTLPRPITREEMFLAKAAGMDVPELKPITRAEMYLAKIAGCGGTGGGGDNLTLLDEAILEYTILD